MSSASVDVRVCCLQLAPVHGRPRESMARADALLSKASAPAACELLVLPELAFTGYQ